MKKAVWKEKKGEGERRGKERKEKDRAGLNVNEYSSYSNYHSNLLLKLNHQPPVRRGEKNYFYAL